MKVLFARPEKYNELVEWYNSPSEHQTYRKLCKFYTDIFQFKSEFNKDKFDAKHTVFYFDRELPSSFIINCFEQFISLYGEETARYISEYKMRTIDVDHMMRLGTFSNFIQLCLSQEFLDKILRKNHKLFVCKSLL